MKARPKRKEICIKLSWFVKLEELIEDVLNIKYDDRWQFKNTLHSLEYAEIVFVDADCYLSSGMIYEMAVLTPSQKIPGENI